MEYINELRAFELVKAALESQSIPLLGPRNLSIPAHEAGAKDAQYLLALIATLVGKPAQ